MQNSYVSNRPVEIRLYKFAQDVASSYSQPARAMEACLITDVPMRRVTLKIFKSSVLAITACILSSGCASGSALQPDRSIFSLDNNYQRHSYAMPIEDTFEQTVSVFKDAGYKLDVTDRATGQISGRRGLSGDKGSATDKDLKFYALVLPKGSGSELSIKIVQVIKSGALGTSKAELIVNDPQMYQYAFKRIENSTPEPSNKPAISNTNAGYTELPATSGYMPEKGSYERSPDW
jgi:hypothetical protein